MNANDEVQEIIGSNVIDTINAAGGDDIIFARGGSDILDGGEGSDQIFAGEGNDTVQGGAGNDFLFGNHDEAPTLNPGSDRDVIRGGEGADLIAGGHDQDVLWGDGGDDVIYGFYSIDNGVSDPTDKDELHGGGGMDYLYGQQADDKLFGDDGNDILFGGKDNDILVGGAGDDILHGGEDELAIQNDGTDTADYSAVENGITVVIVDPVDVPVPGLPGQSFGSSTVSVANDGQGGTDSLISIEKIVGTDKTDTVLISSLAHQGPLEIDGGGQPEGDAFVNGDLVDLSALNGVTLNAQNGIDGTEIIFKNFERLKTSSGDDTIKLNGILDDPNGTENGFVYADLGAGNDVVEALGRGIEVFLGAGDDTVTRAGYGTEIDVGTGSDTVEFANNTRVIGADNNEKITIAGQTLTGGLRGALSETPWTTISLDGVSYAKNTEGDLAIRNALNKKMFVANYTGGPGVAEPTAGITIAEFEIETGHFMEIEKPRGWVEENFRFLDIAWKAFFGKPRRPGADPLVLDLDGDGLELTSQISTSPIFDLDDDGFGERTGWISGDDGLLARDLNSDGKIGELAELFGSDEEDGFTALSALDSNTDGMIDSADADFSDLLIWRDLDQNGETGDGELQTLTEAGITSINLTASTLQDVINAGNEVTHQGSFTKSDGTSGDVFNVDFTLDNFNSVYLGDSTISPEAAALPELKGHGILPSLRISMTQDASLLALVETILPTLNVIDLVALRDAVTPILSAWADISGTRGDVPVLQRIDEDGDIIVDDYAIFGVIDEETGDTGWMLASGADLVDHEGNEVQATTLAELLATDPGSSTWRMFDGAHIEFMEHYLDEEIPFGLALTGSETFNHFNGAAAYMESIIEHVDALAVKLATQGPLSSFFADITLDHEDEVFRADTDRGLIPVFEEIFTALPADNAEAIAYLADWKPILNVVMRDFDRGADYLNVTYSFLFSQLVAAYESVQPASISILEATEPLGIPPELVVMGGPGDLAGTSDHDIFYMNAGDQTARGAQGHDVYVFGKNFGNDVIDDVEEAGQGHKPDLIRFADYASTDISATRIGLDLILTVDATGDTATVLRQFEGKDPGLFGGDLGPDTGIAEIVFSDGVVWDRLEIAYQVADPRATSDTYIGTDTIDVLDGGAGDDRLEGGNETDVYRFGIGYGNDTIKDSMTNILIQGTDYVQFTDGISFTDLILSRDGASNDLVIEIDGITDTLTIEQQFKSNYTGPFDQQWFDRIEIFAFDDGLDYSWDQVLEALLVQAGTDGDDTIYGFDYEDELDGGAGDDFLSGGNENDIYRFGYGYGSDTIDEQRSNILSGTFDIVSFNADVAVADVLLERGAELEDLVIRLNGTSDVLTIKQTFRSSAIIQTVDQIEEFHFNDGTIWTIEDVRLALLDIESTSGDDLIRGFHGNDRLDGGAGNDRLEGWSGGDTYVFGTGYGQDTIHDIPIVDRIGDAVEFTAEITTSDLILSRSDDDLIISISGTSDTLTIEDQFFRAGIGSRDREVEEFRFDDGTIWSVQDVQERFLVSTSGDDLLIGFDTADVLDGGAGDDRLEGLAGSDVYIYDAGYGNDVIYDDRGSFASLGDDDAVHFGSGITVAGVSVSRNVDDLIITLDSSGEALTIEDQFYRPGNETRRNQIEEFHFDDGTIWLNQDIQEFLLQSTVGDDVLLGFDTADTLDGGAGNDRLEGFAGSDIYVYDAGYGNDVISDDRGTYVSLGDDDSIQFGSGVSTADVSVSRNIDDLIITLDSSSETLTIEKYFIVDFEIEEIQFTDGTVWTIDDITSMLTGDPNDPDVINGTAAGETIFGTAADEIIAGNGGDDTVYGLAGSDTFRYVSGDGNDVVEEENVAGTDRLQLTDLDIADLTFTRLISNKRDFEITVDATGETIRVDDQFRSGDYGVEEVEFADGTIWGKTEILQNVWMRGTSSDETIFGESSTDDVIVGNGGDDTMYGLGGNDTYRYTSGDGNDIVKEGNDVGTDRLILTDLNIADLTFTRLVSNKRDFEIAVDATGETITLDDQFRTGNYGVEEVEFADGTIWGQTDFLQNVWMRGSSSDETIFADSETDDVIVGNGGDDTMYGLAGSDTYRYASGDGNDVVEEENVAGTDRLVMTDLNVADLTFTRLISNNRDFELTVNATGETIRVDDQFRSGDYGVEEIEFADGTVWDRATIQTNAWFRGSSGDDTVSGTSDDDTIFGDSGNDTLSGDAGDDTFVFKSGSDDDTITDFQAGSASDDVIELDGLTAFSDFNDVVAATTQNGSDAVVDLGTDGSITLAGINMADLHQDDFRFV
ncbi:MAG: hypothetical protein MPJ78_01305 [Hyphomicrobiaceae bacterium]|nr:hypothetical protein [Hyphomicrobiaceae bacterium]